MTLERLRELLAGEPPYRVRQAAHAVFKEGVRSFHEIAALPAVLRRRLQDVPILCFSPEAARASRDRCAHKVAARLKDGKRIETVLMSPKPGLWTACVSSQIGCALRCGFCATGLMGFSRNLTAEEITDQVLFWRQYLRGCASMGAGTEVRRNGRSPARLSNVVYMGMGEPFLNFENVAASLRRLSDPEQFGFGPRRLSVSTAGIAPGMERFTDAFPQVNLALSLHAATPETRTRLVPINKAYPPARLARALKYCFSRHRRKVFIEYVLLDGENDRPQDARALVRFIRAVGEKPLLHVNLIVWNRTDAPYAPSRPESARRFARSLAESGVHVTFRKNLGQDIDAACGQLVLKT